MLHDITSLLTAYLQHQSQPSADVAPLFAAARQLMSDGEWGNWLESLPIPYQKKRNFVFNAHRAADDPIALTLVPAAPAHVDPTGLHAALISYINTPRGQGKIAMRDEIRAKHKLSVAQFYARLEKVESGLSLTDRRGDHRKGKRTLDEEMQKAFIAHCLSLVRHGNPKLKRAKTPKRLFNLRASVDAFKAEHADVRGVSEKVFRGVVADYQRKFPQMFKTKRQVDIESARQNVCDPPYLNNIWSWDTTTSQVYVYDPQRDRIFNPEFGVMCDEFTPIPLAICYFRDPISKVGFASLLRMACFPKNDLWRACGMPENIHGDKGGVQEGRYAAELQDKYKKVCGQDARATYFNIANNMLPRTPWKNGHAEKFQGYVKDNFERTFCLKRWQHCLGIIDKKGFPAAPTRDLWKMLPTIEQLQEYAEFWVSCVAIQGRHYRLKERRSYSEHWELMHKEMPWRVEVPDRSWFDLILMERTDVSIRSSDDTVTIAGLTGCKWHLLNVSRNYEGVRLTAFYDPNDLRQILLYTEDDGQYIHVGDAKLVTPHVIGNEFTERELVARRNEARRAQKEQKAALAAVTQQAAWNPDVVEEIRKAAEAKRADILPALGTAKPALEEIEFVDPVTKQVVRA